jgi:hypothetical protein
MKAAGEKNKAKEISRGFAQMYADLIKRNKTSQVSDPISF